MPRINPSFSETVHISYYDSTNGEVKYATIPEPATLGLVLAGPFRCACHQCIIVAGGQPMSEESHNPYLDGRWQDVSDNLPPLIDLLIWPEGEEIAQIEEELLEEVVISDN